MVYECLFTGESVDDGRKMGFFAVWGVDGYCPRVVSWEVCRVLFNAAGDRGLYVAEYDRESIIGNEQFGRFTGEGCFRGLGNALDNWDKYCTGGDADMVERLRGMV
jgi:hypothetical protein